MSLLQTQSLTIGVSGRLLCEQLSLKVEAGECWGVLGPNGSGKTTLLHTLAGLRPADNGYVLLNATPLSQLPRREIARHLGLLLQDSHDPFPATVMEEVLSGRHPHLNRWQNESDEDRLLAHEALQRLELSELEQRQIQSLSGGERRRVAMATLLTQSPDLMLLDEPLNHLDLRHQKLLLTTIRDLCGEGHGVVMVLHDPNHALQYCDRILLIYGDGKWEAGDAEVMLNAERLSRLYQCEVERMETEEGCWFSYL